VWFEYICYPNNVCILLHCRRSLQSRLRVLTSQQQHPLRRLPRWCVLYVGHLYQCYYLIITLWCKHGRQVRYDYIHFTIKWSPLVYCIVNELLRLVTSIYHSCMNQHSHACIYSCVVGRHRPSARWTDFTAQRPCCGGGALERSYSRGIYFNGLCAYHYYLSTWQ
jgi:hypothetical protein